MMINLEDDDFKKILFENNSDKIRDFLIQNGKEGKPYCPISFDRKEEVIKSDSAINK
jgi:hypothetical protein